MRMTRSGKADATLYFSFCATMFCILFAMNLTAIESSREIGPSKAPEYYVPREKKGARVRLPRGPPCMRSRIFKVWYGMRPRCGQAVRPPEGI